MTFREPQNYRRLEPTLDDDQESEEHMPASDSQDTVFQEGLDYYLENGLMVLTSAFLARRGYCCERGCRHCPYGYSDNKNKD